MTTHRLAPTADIHLRDPDEGLEAALARVTHLCIAAHQDDVEIMALSAIEACRADDTLSFGAIIVTDGSGAPRSGPFAGLDDAQLRKVRVQEQREAAMQGNYLVTVQLGHASAAVKQGAAEVTQDLEALLRLCRPQVLYVHNPADKHPTHVAVLRRCVEAALRLPPESRPTRLLGCEVWRGLDWLDDASKVPLPNDAESPLGTELLRCFHSQIEGGKRYDLAVEGRRRANATFHQSHHCDSHHALTWALDLTPVLQPGGPSLRLLVEAELAKLHASVLANLS
jgi:LmbE family N-acetylglucosaminyl deacetylase